jgi:hypothetical protein
LWGEGNGSNSNLDVLDSVNSYDSYHTPPPSPCAGGVGLDISVEVFVTPPSSPAATGTRLAISCLTLGSNILTPPSTTAKPTLGTLRTQRPRLSDVFASQVLGVPVPGGDPGLVPMASATLGPAPTRGPAPAGPLVTLGADFIQINCGKRISAMALLETNVKSKIALIQEPYTSINDCTMLHKRDYYSSGTAPPGSAASGTAGAATTGSTPAPCTRWTSLRLRAAIYAPGRTDVLPVYRFTSRDIATEAMQISPNALFVSSIYMDITNKWESPTVPLAVIRGSN